MTVPSAGLVLGLILAGAVDGAAADKDAAPAGKPKLVVKQREVDLGVIREGAKADAVFLLENHGQADLIIDKVTTDCGCTRVELGEKEKVIPPGGAQKVVTTFNSQGRPGKQTKTVTVRSNDPAEPKAILKLTVEVVTLVRITPPSRNFNIGNVRRGELVAKKVRVLPSDPDQRLEIVSFDVPGGALTFTTEPIVRSNYEGYSLRFRVDEDAPLGELQAIGKLVVKVGDQTETKRINIRGRILGDLTVRPLVVRAALEKASPRGQQLRPVVVASATGKPFEIHQASAGANFDVTVEPGQERTEYSVVLNIAEGAADGPCGAFLEILTNSPVQPLIRVPVYVNVAPRLSAKPPLVLLRRDGSADTAGRHVVLQTAKLTEFSILGLTCDRDFMEATTVEKEQPRAGVRVIEVRANERAATGRHTATVTVRTNVPGAKEFEIPVIVTVP